MIKSTNSATQLSIENRPVDYFSSVHSLRPILHMLNTPSSTVCANREPNSQSFLYLKLANYSMLEAMARRMGISLNEMTNEVVTIGIAYILSHLEKNSKKEINELAEKVVQEVELENLLWEEKMPNELNDTVA
jgi:hypothetical protein